MPIPMGILSHGVRRLTVATCSFIKKMMNRGFSAWSVKNSIVWTAGANGIRTCPVHNIKYRILFQKLINSSWSLLREKSLNNVLNASFGFKKIKDVIIWPVSVNFNSATNAGVSIWSVNAFKRLGKRPRDDKGNGNKIEGKNSKSWPKRIKFWY